MGCNKCHKGYNHCQCKGSLYQVKSDDVFYTGSPLGCIGVVPGMNLTKSLEEIASVVCSIPGVSGMDYTGVSGQITVIDHEIGIDPAYTNTINNSIADVASDVLALETCVNDAVNFVESANASIVVSIAPNTSGCGNKAVLTYVDSSSGSLKSGVYYSQPTPVIGISNSYSVAIGTLASQVQTGDILVLKGVLSRSSSKQGTQSFTLTDGTTSIAIGVVGDFSVYGATRKLHEFEIQAQVANVISGQVVLRLSGNFKSTYTYDITPSIMKTSNPDYIAYNNEVSTPFTASSLALSMPNTDSPDLMQFYVELKRKY